MPKGEDGDSENRAEPDTPTRAREAEEILAAGPGREVTPLHARGRRAISRELAGSGDGPPEREAGKGATGAVPRSIPTGPHALGCVLVNVGPRGGLLTRLPRADLLVPQVAEDVLEDAGRRRPPEAGELLEDLPRLEGEGEGYRARIERRGIVVHEGKSRGPSCPQVGKGKPSPPSRPRTLFSRATPRKGVAPRSTPRAGQGLEPPLLPAVKVIHTGMQRGARGLPRAGGGRKGNPPNRGFRPRATTSRRQTGGFGGIGNGRSRELSPHREGASCPCSFRGGVAGFPGLRLSGDGAGSPSPAPLSPLFATVNPPRA